MNKNATQRSILKLYHAWFSAFTFIVRHSRKGINFFLLKKCLSCKTKLLKL